MSWQDEIPKRLRLLLERGYLRASQPLESPPVDGFLTFDATAIEQGQSELDPDAYLAGMMFGYLPWVRLQDHNCAAAPLVDGLYHDEDMTELARIGMKWLVNVWNPARLAEATGWSSQRVSGPEEHLAGNGFLIYVKREAETWPIKLNEAALAFANAENQGDFTVWSQLGRTIGGRVAVFLWLYPYREHFYANVRTELERIKGYEIEECGRRAVVPTDEARPVFGVKKQSLVRYLSPTWWRDEVFGTIRAGWAAVGEVPEETDYVIKVPLTERGSVLKSSNGEVLAEHCLCDFGEGASTAKRHGKRRNE
jgi:hypothetical protein